MRITKEAMMELRQLGLFVGVAEELHFGRAAERLYIAQPALSQHIRRLERELGVELFDRGKRRVRLTSAGAAFYPEARRILERTDHARAVARDAASGGIGNLIVGHIAGIGDEVMAEWIAAITESAPGLAVHLRHLTTAAQASRDLADGDIDIAVLDGALDDPDVESLFLTEEALVAVTHPSLAPSGEDHIDLDSLATPWVVPHRRWLPAASETIHSLRIAAQADVATEAHTISDWLLPAAAGIAVTVAPASIASRWDHVRSMSIRELNPTLALCLSWTPETASPASLLALQVANHVRLAHRQPSPIAHDHEDRLLAVAS